MDSIKALITAHSNATKLEDEIQKVRADLIKSYQNDTLNDIYLLKVKYAGFASQLTKEASIFNKLLKDLESKHQTIPIIADNNNNNIAMGDITENIDCESSVQPQLIVNESYDNNSDILSVQTPHLNLNTDSTTSIPETQTQTQQQQQVSEMKIHKKITNNSNSKWKKKTGYKYTGNGFEVFTGFRNRCKPIYSSTLLYCYETCNGNKQNLRKYLIEIGKFKNEMIKQIIFKQNYSQRYNYALIKVKGPLNYIKKKLIGINKFGRDKNRLNYDIISLFKSKNHISDTEWVFMNKILYVNNFDIIDINSHKRFTNLFLIYGELEKDVIMGIDSYGEPYAIVYFKDLNDAKKCIELELLFDSKILNVRFYKN